MAVFPTGAIHRPVHNYVWDVGTLAWVVETQPGGGGGGGGAVTVADGADVAEGATTDVAVTGDTAGSVSAKLRGILKTLDGFTASGNLSINGGTLEINTRGMGSLSIWQPGVAGGWDGTLNFEGTNDGASWFAVKVARQDDGQIITSFSNTAFVIRVNVAGFEKFRLRVSARTAGNTDITMYASPTLYQSYISTSILDQSSGNHLTIDGFGAAKVNIRNDAGSTILGTAGTAAADVLTMQGIAGGTPVGVSATSLPLPTGAATAVRQDTGNASLASIDTKLTSPLTVTGPLTDVQLRANPVPVSATSLPLPAGAATEATLLTRLASTDGTTLDIEKAQGRYSARTIDDRVVEELQGVRETLGRILQVMEYEFEQISEETYGSED